MRDFDQITWDARLESDCRQLVRLAVLEDLNGSFDVTTRVLVADSGPARADVVFREAGVVCGLRAAAVVLDEMAPHVGWEPRASDGQRTEAGGRVATISGPASDLLTTERLVLNMIGRLSGIATLTRAFVDRIAGTGARIYDTRKTTPGWRRLEKYAVRCGGGSNHRTGLFDAVLIKDNHLAQLGPAGRSPGEAVDAARSRLRELLSRDAHAMIVEVEVDSLQQLDDVLPRNPDIVLLDNMAPAQLRAAVARRDALRSPSQLEASGGVTLDSVRDVAESGVERISVGALTHSATSLDVALDWQ
ncbi:MAG: carboxylating nicotinate-nucleotide diphosphorylase [Planctomycetes bacterium]|nr:carboxylating nicotinate-nucleotide diphosphorylase [Planctomycetota bacterium]